MQGNNSDNIYYNSNMSARLCMQTPFGEGCVERETIYEGKKFFVLKLRWGRAYINEKEIQNTRISLSPPPEIYTHFVNNGSSNNISTRPGRLSPPPLFATIGNANHRPPQLTNERDRQISADEEFARQLQNSFTNANNLEMTVEDVNNMSEEALIELVLGENSVENQNNIEDRYQMSLNGRRTHSRVVRPPAIPPPTLMSGSHRRASSNGRRSSRGRNITSSRGSGNYRRKLGGASVNEITRLPKFVYKPSEKHSGTSKSCTVCMEDYKEGDSLRSLPCLHQFHANCIDEWLGYKSTCPVCKASITNS